MSNIFRSQEMALCQLFIQNEATYQCVSELGEIGIAEFRDLNSEINHYQRKYVNEVRRCSEMERKLRYLEKDVKKDNIPILDCKHNPEAPEPREIIDLEAVIDKLEQELREINQNLQLLKQSYSELTEFKHVLHKSEGVFPVLTERLSSSESITKALITSDMGGEARHAHLNMVAGVIPRERIPAFERMLWRSCRGNAYLRQAEIEQPLEDSLTGDQISKSVFYVFFQGEQLKSRVIKICDGFRATIYPIPDTPHDRREIAIGVMSRLEDLNLVIEQTQTHRRRALVATAKQLKVWFIKVQKMKAIYHTMNMFDVQLTNKSHVAECWVPAGSIPDMKIALKRGTECSGISVAPVLTRIDTTEEPPTFNKTNKFTNGFQNLIDAYGVARYREVNPMPYTIITFPFLFSVMFGDVGHGAIMTAFGAWMVLCEKSLDAKKSTNEIWNIFFGGRYIIFLMGCFSIYTGFIYNDCFSKSLNIFGSSWNVLYSHKDLMNIKDFELDPKDAYIGNPYPFGLDPIWGSAQNNIRFSNSYKMKISIIFGVTQMLFGVVLSVCNYSHFKLYSEIWTMFVPQIIFLLFLFAYLVFLVFIKWMIYGPTNPVLTGTFCAPSILITFINMIMFKQSVEVPPCSQWIYPKQQQLQLVLVLVAVLCIPWMLIANPFVVLMKRRKEQRRLAKNDTEVGAKGQYVHETPMGEVWIHQIIHTIEFVLGSVSHTASYLRLWALSLAHGSLSEVMWKMVMKIGLESKSYMGGVKLYFVFFIWAILSVGILVLMEGLSAFLHTLRLHWVEFQSKFYSGTGTLFMPFAFKTILIQAETSQE